MSEKTLPIDVLGDWYEVPIQVQLHIIALRERLAELERAAAQPAPKFEAPEIDDAMADRVQRNYFLAPGVTSGAELGRQIISAVRSELGPALGLVELREPTAEECERIADAFLSPRAISSSDKRVRIGRALFNSVRAVMWPKSEAK